MLEPAAEALAALLARGPLHDLTPEQVAQRRAVIIQALADKASGVLPPTFVRTPVERVRAPRIHPSRSVYRFATEAERTEARRQANDRCNAKARAEVAAGLRAKKVTPYTPVVRVLTLPVGKWITFQTSRSLQRTVLILAAVPALAQPVIPLGSDLKQNGGIARPSTSARYLLALPPQDRMATPGVMLTRAAELDGHILETFDSPPEYLIGRLVVPAAPGTRVTWTSQGAGRAFLRTGVIEAYVPAGQSARKVARFREDPRNPHADESQRDRYIVRQGATHFLPPAYVIERAILQQRAEQRKTA